MIIIINGPLGVGKTETSWNLLYRFDRGVMLDGDYLGAVWPFEIYDAQRVEYLYQTLRHNILFHTAHGYQNFIINYVFEQPETLARLRSLLDGLAGEILAFRLVCDETEHERRVRGRSTDGEQLAWELQRFRELQSIQTAAAARGDLGYVIDTTHLSLPEVGERIWKIAQQINSPSAPGKLPPA